MCRERKEMAMKISVVIPVFNEEKTIKEVIKKVQEVDIEKEIIIVDDGSTDKTRDILDGIKENNIKIIFHKKNLGKGGALKTGFSNAVGDIIIPQDADLELDPKEYHNLIGPILEDYADVVYGSRFAGGRPRGVYRLLNKLGNDFLTSLTNIIYNTTLTDMETCYKVFKKEVLEGIEIKSRDFTIEPELTAKTFKKKCRVCEVPVSYYARGEAEGKKIKWWHAISAVGALIKYRFVD